jgi:sporulation protein YlmC with PRC-barrel domain
MKVSEYYDMPIYSDKGRYVGEVQDVVLDLDNGEVLGLGFGEREGKVTTVPYENVMAIGDIILVRSGQKKRVTPRKEEETED